MIYSSIGFYALIFGLVMSLPVIFFSIKNLDCLACLDEKKELITFFVESLISRENKAITIWKDYYYKLTKNYTQDLLKLCIFTR